MPFYLFFMRLFSNNQWLQHAAARSAMRHGRFAVASQIYSVALEHKPTFESAFGLAQALFKAGDFSLAANAYERALSLPGDHLQAHDMLAECLLWLGELNNAIHHSKEVINAQRPSPHARWVMACAQYQREEYDLAMASAEKGLKLAPDDSALLMIHAMALARKKDERAYDCLINAEKTAVTSGSDWLSLADAFMQCNCFCKALSYVERYIARYGENARAMLLLGTTYYHLNCLTQAIAALKRVPLDAAEYAQARITMAGCYAQRGEKSADTKCITDLAREKPTPTTVTEACRNLVRSRNHEAVIRLCKEHEAFLSDEPALAAILARSLFATDKVQEAREHLKQAEEQKGDDPWALGAIFHAHVVAGDIEAAKQALYALEDT